jgi:hypothetical protein
MKKLFLKEFLMHLSKLYGVQIRNRKLSENGGPEGFYAPSIRIDLKKGGKYIFPMHGP